MRYDKKQNKSHHLMKKQGFVTGMRITGKSLIFSFAAKPQFLLKRGTYMYILP